MAYQNIPPAVKAAQKLFTAGVTEEDLRKHKKVTLMEDTKFMSVQNELRNMWKGITHDIK